MKTIKISDGTGHMNETVTMDASTITSGTGWVIETLKRNGFAVDELMTDEDIRQAAYAAFTGQGYDGDPVANGLTVTVSD